MTPTATATDSSTSPKRTRFSSDVHAPPAKNPLANAMGSLTSAIMSLPSSLQAPSKLHSEKFLRMYNSIAERFASKNKLEKADQPPQPIRFKYVFKSNIPAAAETPEFKVLQAKSERTLSECQDSLRQDMISLAGLEIGLMQRDLSIIALDLLLLLCWTYVFLSPELAEADLPHNVKALLGQLTAMPSIKKILMQVDDAYIKTKICRYQPDAPETLTVTPTLQMLATDIEKVYLSLTLTPCEVYDSTLAKNRQLARVAANARLIATDSATAAAAAELDMETSVTPTQLDSLIETKFNALMKRSKNRSNSRSEKNDRGAAKAPASSAPEPKKTPTTPRAQKQRPRATTPAPPTATAAPLSAKAKARAKKQKEAAAAARNNAASAANNPDSQKNSTSRKKGRQRK